MIDTKLMNQATFDSQTGIATIGGGTLNAGVYEALSQNNATITHGRCPTVGAAGFLLGGGIGFNIRRLGIGCDAMVASQLVTADGEILPSARRRTSMPGYRFCGPAARPTRSVPMPPPSCIGTTTGT
jgi:FAD/FMN-containing dehydrogenase